jgi:hypothetical protein
VRLIRGRIIIRGEIIRAIRKPTSFKATVTSLLNIEASANFSANFRFFSSNLSVHFMIDFNRSEKKDQPLLLNSPIIPDFYYVVDSERGA